MNTFEITIQRAQDGGWPVVVRHQPSPMALTNWAQGVFALDPNHLDLIWPGDRQYGTLLGQSVFHDDVRDAFVRAISGAKAASEPLRVFLIVEAEDLRSWHWEQLCAPFSGGRWDYLLLNQQTPFSLYLPSQIERRFPPIGRRDLRALLLVAGPEELEGDYGLEPFDVSATVAALQSSLGEIPYDVLANLDEGITGKPSLNALCDQLTANHYTLLFIVSHGAYRQEVGETILYFPEDENRRPVTGSMLIERLGRLESAKGLPNFTFLSTCESADPQAEYGLGGLGQRLVRELGMPAVLAMTNRVSIQTAQALSEAFCSRLVEHGEVDRALAEALAGLQGRYDVTVPALFSRLGGRPLFSDALDRPLTSSEIQYGAELLGKLVHERAPVLEKEYSILLSKLQASPDIKIISSAAKQEIAAALETANTISDEIADLSFHALALGRPIPPYDTRCPFPGLASFRPQDRPFFFGREELVDTLLDRLDSHPFLAVLGPSGSGKSSLVLAGLVPELAQSTPGCSEESIYAYLTPGVDPLARLEAALSATPDCALVVIDQFEELFTLCPDENERVEFIQRILKLRQTHRIVLTMRADFWGECAHYSDLKDEMQAHQELVGPLDAAGMRRAIEQQAAVVGLRFEADLADDILDDVKGEPGAMPLLQHALLLLWERRHGRWLRSAEYRSFGGVQQAIAHTADGIYLKLDPADRERVRDIFLRLTRLDEDPASGIERRDTRRRVTIDELVPAGSERGRTVELVRQLADARLVVTGVNPISDLEEVEVAHEALIRYWKRLQTWLEEDRTALRQGEMVREAARLWDESQREDEGLLVHRGGRLDDALDLDKRKGYTFNQLEIDYLDACQALREREKRSQERRRTQWLIAAVSAALIFAVLAGFGFFQSNRASRQEATAVAEGARAERQQKTAEYNAGVAERQQKTAEYSAEVAEQQTSIARAGELAAISQLYVSDQIDLALLLSVEAIHSADTPQSRSALFTALQTYPYLGRLLISEEISLFRFSADGRYVIGWADQEVFVWDLAGGPNLHWQTDLAPIYDLAWSGDGVVAVADDPKAIFRLEPGESRPKPLLPNLQNFGSLVRLSSDGRTLAYGGCAETGTSVPLVESPTQTSVNEPTTVSPPSQSGSTCTQGQVTVVDVDSGKLAGPWQVHSSRPFQLNFLTDGRVLSMGCTEGSMIPCSEEAALINPHTGLQQVVVLPDEFHTVLSTKFIRIDTDGPQVGSFVEDDPLGNLVVWDLETNEKLFQTHIDNNLYDYPYSTLDFILRQGGRQVAVPSNEGLWVVDARGDRPLANRVKVTDLDFPFLSITISPDGEIFAARPDRRPYEPVTGRSVYIFTGNTLLPNLTLPLGRSADEFRSAILESPLSKPVGRDANGGGLIFDLGAASPTRPLYVNSRGCSELVAAERLCKNYGVTFWDTESLKPLKEAPSIHPSGVTAWAFSRDGTWLATADGGHLVVWDANDLEPATSTSLHLGLYNNLTFSPDSNYLLAGEGGSNNLYVWHLPTLTPVDLPDSLKLDHISDLAFSPDGGLLVAITANFAEGSPKIVFIDPVTWRVVKTAEGPSAIAFSPDGTQFVTAGLNGTLRIWDREELAPISPEIIMPRNLKFISPVPTIRDPAIELIYTPDGKTLVIGTTQFIILWDIESRQMIGLPFGDFGLDIGLSHDGLRLFTSNRLLDQPPLVWSLDPLVWEKVACQAAGRNLTQAEWGLYFSDEEYRKSCPQWPPGE